MTEPSFRTQLQEVLHDIIEGKIVKRSRHDLRWETRDVTLEFIEALKAAGYEQTIVQNVNVKPGERASLRRASFRSCDMASGPAIKVPAPEGRIAACSGR